MSNIYQALAWSKVQVGEDIEQEGPLPKKVNKRMRKDNMRKFTAILCLVALVCFQARAEDNASMAEALQPFVSSNAMAGAVLLVASPQKVFCHEAVGYMDLAAKKPMKTDCMFWIASQSKPITAAALMILVDEGKVNVDDPVEKYLPEFKGQMVIAEKDGDHILLKKPKHPPLVRNVLSHTSGLPFSTNIEHPTLDLFPLEIRVRSYAKVMLQTEPDAKYQYSNAGINTAGRIIEVVSGMSYEKFLDERIFKPLGMKDTTFWPNEEQISRIAKSYKPVKDGLEECNISQLKYPLNDMTRQPMPAGGLFATAVDVCKFYTMLANNGMFEGKRIISEESVKMMTSDQTGDLKHNYGFGIGANERFFGHGGAYNTNTRFEKNNNLIMVFLSQHAGFGKGGKKALPTFHHAAITTFAEKAKAN